MSRLLKLNLKPNHPVQGKEGVSMSTIGNGIGRTKLCCSRRRTSRLPNLDLISNQRGKDGQGFIEGA